MITKVCENQNLIENKHYKDIDVEPACRFVLMPVLKTLRRELNVGVRGTNSWLIQWERKEMVGFSLNLEVK